MWTTIQIILGLLGVLLIFVGDRLSVSILGSAGLGCLGLAAMAIGWEAIITRQIKFGSRRRGSRETYTGLPAVLQGIQFNLIGLFLIGITVLVYLDDGSTGRGIFLQFVRRPGLPLMLFGALLLMQAVITISGFLELREGPRWIVILNLAVSRLLPGIILMVIGLGALGLGLFEVVAPNVFDEMGGGFLEVLYGVR
jgi:hypothetical protein